MAAKTVLVDFDYHEPKFTFTGDWTGKDIRVLVANLRRAYLRHQKSIRDKATSQPATDVAQVQEVSQ